MDFYLGKLVDPKTGKLTDDRLLYDAKDLCTHAVCVGMTGSGKTGLGIALLEEAGLNKIPAIVIDPKGDVANLLLTFPDLSPASFKPWTENADEAAAKWEKGLGQDKERIQKLRDAVDLKIYTPANNSGIPISILNSFAAPSLDDEGLVRDRLLTTTSSLLGLLGIKADPLKSREHILISSIIMNAWNAGKNVDIPSLIQEVQKPPFNKIGALDIDTFYPPKERMELSIRLNNLLASPGFKAWMEGEPLDIQKLLYSDSGKPSIAIISIAHLSDAERMFFVTLLLNAYISWMRQQEGTPNLRALLYMDEIFGYFPPTAAPPSKLPMLTLLKQARAFGIGIVLVTQNPVDLDYKGLSNCGTWFIGKLQTERDKMRVLEGLEVASNGDIDAKTLDKMIRMTGNRTFIMRSVHEKDPILFQTRWTLSFLAGPMTLAQIARLTPKTKSAEKAPEVPTKPLTEVPEFYYNKGNHYEPRMIGFAKVHFVDAKNRIDAWKDVIITTKTDWSQGVDDPTLKNALQNEPLAGAKFSELPSFDLLEKSFAQYLYQHQAYTLFQMGSQQSKAGESETDFKNRISQERVQKISDAYKDKIETWKAKLKRAQDKMTDRQQKVGLQKIQTYISAGVAIIGALLGKKVTKGTITETGTTLRRASRIGNEQQKATDAEEDVKACEEKLAELQKKMEEEIAAIDLGIETIDLHPKKSDIMVDKVGILWWGV